MSGGNGESLPEEARPKIRPEECVKASQMGWKQDEELTGRSTSQVRGPGWDKEAGETRGEWQEPSFRARLWHITWGLMGSRTVDFAQRAMEHAVEGADSSTINVLVQNITFQKLVQSMISITNNQDGELLVVDLPNILIG